MFCSVSIFPHSYVCVVFRINCSRPTKTLICKFQHGQREDSFLFAIMWRSEDRTGAPRLKISGPDGHPLLHKGGKVLFFRRYFGFSIWWICSFHFELYTDLLNSFKILYNTILFELVLLNFSDFSFHLSSRNQRSRERPLLLLVIILRVIQSMKHSRNFLLFLSQLLLQ